MNYGMLKADKSKIIMPEISIDSHIKLTRARETAAYIYDHIKNHSCDGESMPWLPEILDYLCGDIDVILREIDEWELRDSQSMMRTNQS